MKLHTLMTQREREDIKAETEDGAESLPKKGLKWYWKAKNTSSIDGLPGLRHAFCSAKIFDENIAKKDWGKDDERLSTEVKFKGLAWSDAKMIMGFVLGVVASALWMNFFASAGHIL